MSTWQFAALISIFTNFLETNVTISFFASLHWWKVIDIFLTYPLRLRLLLHVTKGEHHLWHALEYSIEWITSHTTHIVHLNVICSIEVYLWVWLGWTNVSTAKCLYLWLIHPITIRNSDWLSETTWLTASWSVDRLPYNSSCCLICLRSLLSTEKIIDGWNLCCWTLLLYSRWRIALYWFDLFNEVRIAGTAPNIIASVDVYHTSELSVTAVAEIFSQSHSIGLSW